MLSCIYLDLDGVCVDFPSGLARLMGLDRDLFYSERCDHYGAEKQIISEELGIPFGEEELHARLGEAGAEFWMGLEKYSWTDDLIEMCSEYAPVMIMTKPAQHPSSSMGKHAWIQKNLPKIQRFSLTNSKHHTAHRNAFLIDDYDEGVRLFREHNGLAYLFPQPWNCKAWKTRNPIAELETILRGLQ